MLECFVIFTKGGAVLWKVGQPFDQSGSPIDSLIQQCLLEDRGGESSYLFQPASGTPLTLKWTLDNVRF